MLDLLISLFALVYSFLLLFIVFHATSSVPFVPSSTKRFKEIDELVNFYPTDTFYDLGSGDGRLIRYVAKLGVKKAVGFERNYFLVLYSKILNKIHGLKNAKILYSNLFVADFGKADKIFVFLLPEYMSRLEPILLEKCKPGTLIISNTFKFPNLKPKKQIGKTLIYIIN